MEKSVVNIWFSREKSAVFGGYNWEKSVISILYPYRDSINPFC